MKKITFLIAFASSLLMFSSIAISETCIFKGEQKSKMNKICYYECPSGLFAYTIKVNSICDRVFRR